MPPDAPNSLRSPLTLDELAALVRALRHAQRDPLRHTSAELYALGAQVDAALARLPGAPVLTDPHDALEPRP
jgi:hypothetical protein